jgi:hypothetical protein
MMRNNTEQEKKGKHDAGNDLHLLAMHAATTATVVLSGEHTASAAAAFSVENWGRERVGCELL